MFSESETLLNLKDHDEKMKQHSVLFMEPIYFYKLTLPTIELSSKVAQQEGIHGSEQSQSEKVASTVALEVVLLWIPCSLHPSGEEWTGCTPAGCQSVYFCQREVEFVCLEDAP